MSYVRDPATRVLERTGFAGIDYSDGAALEEGLLAALRACKDVSAGSAELGAHITDWPSEYHLSPLRHNLLRALPLAAGERVLELGCGCGAITRFLGERGARVLAVEGSRRRAQIAAERCRDLPGVQVACDNLAHLALEERFDVVTLIGVLEYSRRFIQADDPVLECLRRARARLADGGRLVLAIENQLGLKYFAGCAEDHLDRPYAGIEDLYTATSAVTFGRRELDSLLARAGFAARQWSYPFPDYKLPTVVVTDAAFSSPALDLPSLLFTARSRDYRGSRLRVFDEALARRGAWKNGLLADMANSFLVVASPGALPPADGLAHAYNCSRHPAFWTATRFDEGVRVERRYLTDGTRPAGRFTHQLVKEAYVAGPLHVEALHAIARSSWTIDSLAAWAKPWFDLLPRRELPADFVDCTPFNCVSSAGKLTYIDAEWRASEPVPLAWVFIRGLAYSLGECMPPQDPVPRKTLIAEIGRRLGLALADSDFREAEDREQAFQSFCRPLRGGDVLGEMLGRAAGGPLSVYDALAEAGRDLERMRASRSWRLTQPLRSALDWLRRLRGG